MVNLKLFNFTDTEYSTVRDLICKNLKDNPAFIDNDIIISDFFAPANIIDITLCGDDGKELYLSGSINTIKGLESSVPDASYYIQTINGSGISTNSKADFLQRISDLVDQAHQQGQKTISVDIDVYLKGDENNG